MQAYDSKWPEYNEEYSYPGGRVVEDGYNNGSYQERKE
jgi:hypothetical protein